MKRFFPLYFFLLCTAVFGQNQPWVSYFSYNDIVDVSQSPSRVFGAAGSAMFEKNMGTNDLKTITSVDGLKAEGISAVHYSTTYNRTLVGNSNGLLIVINGDNTIVNKIGIVQEATVLASKKRINHILEYNGKAYLSCDFGIAVFDLATLEFGDTYYLGPNGSEIPVKQAAIHNGNIFAASSSDGVRFASLANPNLNDYTQWTQYIFGNVPCVSAYNGQLYISRDNVVYRLAESETVFATMPSTVVDLREANGYFVATATNRVTVYNPQLTQVAQINVIPLPEAENAAFTCATVVSETLFVGTLDRGMYSAGFNSLNFENITPDGPQRSNIFRMAKTSSALWAVYGDYSAGYNPHPLEYFGISKFNENGWTTIPNSKLYNAASISDIIVNPQNENEIYVASYHEGLIKIEGEEPVAHYNYTPAIQNGPESLDDPTNAAYRSARINSLAFDKQGNLWMTNAMIERGVKVRRSSGSWSSYSMKDILANPIVNNYSKMVIDKNNTKWIPTSRSGVLAFNEGLNNKAIIIGEGSNGNLPFFDAKCVAIDNNNRLWIGTARGLRVLSGVDRFTTENSLTTNPIIIMEDGLAQELMYEQGIIDIVVDGSNNKWIGTAGAGAFLVSPDGQQTLFHFTKENSPLPSNVINDIEINHATGEVFFATDRGMVSYRGTSTEASGDLSKVYVFPNPVRPGFEGDVNISALTDNANVKITDIEGNLVFETTSEGGTVLWDTRAFGKYKVASGVYMIFISSEDGTQTKVKKLMIVR